MTLLIAAGWALVGAVAGVVVRVASVRLARGEGLEPGRRAWQRYGPVLLTAALFGLFGWRIGAGPALLIRSLWVAVLVQVIFFDLEHQLVLDRVLLPGAVAALVLSLVTPHLGLVPAVLTGLVTGLVFLAIAEAGRVVFKAEAMGFGDVKLSAFLGLILGPRPTFNAVVVGVILAGVVAVGLLSLRLRGMRDSISYGPFLAAGALASLFTLGAS
ncbi:MAG TPA: A24 family peptidase [Candidatus Dormibacteraeota bacterium]|jgi:prepilin signal peptidase PulO-like enzyme (type II secretory pathway)